MAIPTTASARNALWCATLPDLEDDAETQLYERDERDRPVSFGWRTERWVLEDLARGHRPNVMPGLRSTPGSVFQRPYAPVIRERQRGIESGASWDVRSDDASVPRRRRRRSRVAWLVIAAWAALGGGLYYDDGARAELLSELTARATIAATWLGL